MRLNLEDKSTLGGTSSITLYFDPEVQNLTQWRIVDPQGFQTMVTLNKIGSRHSASIRASSAFPTPPVIGGNR